MTTRKALGIYAVLGVVLWPVPLLNILHVESAAVVALVAFFVAGWAALDAFRRPALSLSHVLLTQEALLAVPVALLTVSLLWAPNCDYLRGLLFYGLFPGITVMLAVALAYALRGLRVTHPKAWLGGIGLFVAVAGPIYDLGFHPQFYTYNHVFGGVLGPIYDEQLAVRFGLFTFRGLTLLWAAWLVVLGAWVRLRRDEFGRAGPEGRLFRYRIAFLVLTLLIGGSYFFSARLGFNTPAWYLQAQLGGHRQTPHFDMYYDPASLAAYEVDALAKNHEYRYAWLADQLGTEGPERIVTYLYPSPEVKAQLTGARTTSVAPVWLDTPQAHVLLDAYATTFGHELVHVFSRRFGLPVLHASWAVGLVEGLAVAFEPPDGRPTPSEQVMANLLSSNALTVDGLTERVAARLQPLGFWTGRGAVSYTTMGSFVEYLRDRYGPRPLRRVYACANFEAVYGRSLDALTAGWGKQLRAQALVARAAGPLVTRRFARPSLFERRCPHYTPPYVRMYRDGQEALAAGDTARARHRFAAALDRQPHFTPAHEALARLRLARGAAAAVIRQVDTLATRWMTPSLRFVLADAYAIAGHAAEARWQYRQVLQQMPAFAHETLAHVTHRQAVAARPDVVRILTAGDSAAAKAERLRTLPHQTPAIRAWAARQWMAAGHHRRALRVWQGLPSVLAPGLPRYQRGLLRRERLRWQARSALGAEAYPQAAEQARRAAAAFREVGALNLAAAAEDLAQKAMWLRDRSLEGRLGAPAASVLGERGRRGTHHE